MVWTILASVEIGRGGVNTRRNRESKAIELLGELETRRAAQQLVVTRVGDLTFTHDSRPSWNDLGLGTCHLGTF